MTFLDGGTVLGTANPNFNGTTDTVTFTTSSLPGGSDPITAVFSGDLNFNGSTSNTVMQAVGLPTVSSPTDTNITATSATLGGDVTSNGGTAITDRGIVYALTSANANPTIGGAGSTQVSAGGTTGVFTTNVTGLTASSSYSFVAYVTNANGTTYSSVGAFRTNPDITAVVINQDISALYNAAGQPTPGVQRSMVEDIVYTFSEPVNFSSDPNVFSIAVAAGWTGTVPGTVEWAPVAGSGNTQWEVDFGVNPTASGSEAGALNSIVNGAYTITLNDPNSITAQSDAQALSLAPAGISSATQSFYRLFGDINGDEVVNPGDNNRFKQALTTYNPAFDFNQDGAVNPGDNNKFKADLAVSFVGFTPTI